MSNQLCRSELCFQIIQTLKNAIFPQIRAFLKWFFWGWGWIISTLKLSMYLLIQKIENKDNNLHFKILLGYKNQPGQGIFGWPQSPIVFIKKESKKKYNTTGNTPLNICVCKVLHAHIHTCRHVLYRKHTYNYRSCIGK